MNLWIAFFRGINVGGRNVLPMKELKALLKGIGCHGVQSYIQSGNVVFRHATKQAENLEAVISAAVQDGFGIDARVLLLTLDELVVAIATNPFPAGEAEPKSLHLFFLAEDAIAADWAALETLKFSTEQFQLINRVFYLHAPDGIGRSKLAAKVEKNLGVPVTARNWRTVARVLQLATELSD
jgi:uncharacterized protein (DUF1697 family)